MKKVRAEKVLAMLKGGGGGHSKFWGSFDVLAKLMGRGGGVAKSLHPLKWGGGWRAKSFTLS